MRTKTWLEIDGQFVVGEHGLELLRRVDSTGSLAAAARACGWSYRHAWGYIKNAEAVLGDCLIVVHPGRGKGRGAVLSNLGREVSAYGTQCSGPGIDNISEPCHGPNTAPNFGLAIVPDPSPELAGVFDVTEN